MGIEQDGGSRINDVEGLDDVLLLAIRIGWDTADIFEIDLPTGHGSRALQWLMDAMVRGGNASMGFENTIDGFARRNGKLKKGEQRITLQVILDGLLAR